MDNSPLDVRQLRGVPALGDREAGALNELLARLVLDGLHAVDVALAQVDVGHAVLKVSVRVRRLLRAKGAPNRAVRLRELPHGGALRTADGLELGVFRSGGDLGLVGEEEGRAVAYFLAEPWRQEQLAVRADPLASQNGVLPLRLEADLDKNGGIEIDLLGHLKPDDLSVVEHLVEAGEDVRARPHYPCSVVVLEVLLSGRAKGPAELGEPEHIDPCLRAGLEGSPEAHGHFIAPALDGLPPAQDFLDLVGVVGMPGQRLFMEGVLLGVVYQGLEIIEERVITLRVIEEAEVLGHELLGSVFPEGIASARASVEIFQNPTELVRDRPGRKVGVVNHVPNPLAARRDPDDVGRAPPLFGVLRGSSREIPLLVEDE